MILLDTLFVGGLKFVLRRVADAVDAQMNDEGVLRDELLAAQMRYELGEIDEAELHEVEADVLARLRAVRERQREGEAAVAPGAGTYRVEGIETAFDTSEPPFPAGKPSAPRSSRRRKSRRRAPRA